MAGLLKFVILVSFVGQFALARQYVEPSAIPLSESDIQLTEPVQQAEKEEVNIEQQVIVPNDDHNNNHNGNLSEIQRAERNVLLEQDLAIVSQRRPRRRRAPPEEQFVIQIMERIARIFRSRLPDNAGSEFAVLAIIPESIRNPSDIDALLAPNMERVN